MDNRLVKGVQSANSVFHFMEKMEFLKDAISNRRLSPRYFLENTEYLKLKSGRRKVKQIAILGLCFCDIPFHKLKDKNHIEIIHKERGLKKADLEKLRDRSSHADIYGEYAIVFSKEWSIKKGMQPVHYVSGESYYVDDLTNATNILYKKENVDEEIADIVLDNIMYAKPIYGEMTKTINAKKVDIKKNFHDEQEWRYIPEYGVCYDKLVSNIIVQREMFDELFEYSESIRSNNVYEELWLKFEYDDIKYIIVSSKEERKEILEWIEDNIVVEDKEKERETKNLLINKILVLSEIGEDW